MNSSYNYLFKYIIVGDTSKPFKFIILKIDVGKSCLLLQYVDRRFRQSHDTTIGVEFGAKVLNIDQKIVKIQVWDTAGQESFRSITRSYYRGSIGALLVYDITQRESFESLIRWIEEVKQWGQEKLQIVLVGNKIDLENNRQVTYDEAKDLASKYDIEYFETSAKENQNVDEVFMSVAQKIYGLIQNDKIDIRNENCGIKVGQRGNAIDDNENILEEKKQKEGCC